MTPLGRKLAERIAREGPISVAEFMAACLGDAEHGYYRGRDAIGAQGDFVTAPEISQMFGELLGLWAAQAWVAIGRPRSVILAELGPGRGTLMADALRAVRKAAPDFAAALSLHLVEINAALRSRQAAALADASPTWHESHTRLPDGPLILVANEYLDALPVRQFVRHSGVWRERCVALDETRQRFCFVSGPAAPHGLGLRAEAPDGAIAEVRPAAEALGAWLGGRLAEHPGATLFVDYGSAAGGLGDTLQAVRSHRFADPLADPGETDLSAHVDFAAFARAAQAAGAEAQGPVPQGALLRRLGIEARAAVLLRAATRAQAAAIDTACQFLIGETRMGRVFKALALATRGVSTLPGFDPEDRCVDQPLSSG